ncbi:MAG TPA: hypothetical protein VHQ65_10055, partial [Thermoanaerobaculia bacterium]|nr:hypothetical protein [Thermoanaerobaculia bacterium]
MRSTAGILLSIVCLLGPCVGATPAAGGPPEVLQITGTVAGADGPAAGARASLLPLPSNHEWHRDVLAGRGEREPVAATAAAPDGRFAVEAPAPGMWSLVASAPGRVPMRYVPLAVTAARELPPLALLADAGVEVTVRRRDGRAAAEAWVLLTSASPELWRPLQADGWGVAPRLGRTDAAGRLALPRAPGEALEVTAFVPGSRATVAVPGGASRATLVLEPPRAGDPSGSPIELRDADGSPAAGAVVTAGSPAWPLGTTDGAGQLVLPAGVEGPLDVL